MAFGSHGYRLYTTGCIGPVGSRPGSGANSAVRLPPARSIIAEARRLPPWAGCDTDGNQAVRPDRGVALARKISAGKHLGTERDIPVARGFHAPGRIGDHDNAATLTIASVSTTRPALASGLSPYVQVPCERAVVAGHRRRSYVIDVGGAADLLDTLTSYERNEESHWAPEPVRQLETLRPLWGAKPIGQRGAARQGRCRSAREGDRFALAIDLASLDQIDAKCAAVPAWEGLAPNHVVHVDNNLR